MSWYALRVTYGRELKFQQRLSEAGFETFVPMKRKEVLKDGKKITLVVPAVSNLLFVNTLKCELDEFMRGLGDSCNAHYIWDKATGRPAVVPDKPMGDFIHVCDVMSDEVMYLKEISAKLREGQKVKVLEGPFKGIEGIVVRIKRSRRVVVELPGMLAVATAYISPKELELL